MLHEFMNTPFRLRYVNTALTASLLYVRDSFPVFAVMSLLHIQASCWGQQKRDGLCVYRKGDMNLHLGMYRAGPQYERV
jgi:hypothetical protein